MYLTNLKSSIVGKTALLAALLSGGVSVFIFAIIFAAQQSSYETQLADHVADTLKNLGFTRDFSPEAARSWLKRYDEDLGNMEDIVYTYFTTPGADPTNPFGKLHKEEPNVPTTESPGSMIIFHAKGNIIGAHDQKLKTYERLGLISFPLVCAMAPCGEIRVVVRMTKLDEVLSRLRVSLVIAALLIPLITGLIVFLTAQTYLAPIRLLSKRMRELAISKDGAMAKDILKIVPTDNKANTVETIYFAESVAMLADAISQANSLKSRLQATESTTHLARQVAHDIRSPAAVLDYALANETSLPEEKRAMIMQALARIQGIANRLLRLKDSAYSEDFSAPAAPLPEDQEIETIRISETITQIIQEKRLMVSGQDDVTLELTLPENKGYGLFVKAPKKELQAVFSNILNNAVESLDDKRRISCTLSDEGRFCHIVVIDEGRGIPEHILPRIFTRGFTHGKDNGNGLGLFHARSVIESIGGSIQISSKPATGTEVLIKLPKSAAPPWFVPELKVSTKTNIVICDDDPEVHKIWQHRFQIVGIDSGQVINFLDLSSFKSWWTNKDSKAKGASFLFLFDHDFRGDRLTGTDIIRDLGLSWQSVLVTTRFDSFSDDQYLNLGQLGLLWKGNIGDIPIAFEKGAEFKGAFLIDDDDFVRDAWKIAAKSQGIELITATHPRDIFSVLSKFPLTTAFFIDSELGYGLKGELIGKRLFEQGYVRIIITSGHGAEHFTNLSFLYAVISKDPPQFRTFLDQKSEA